MSTWITSMAHFPGPSELNKRMSMALIQTTLHFGSIVKQAATSGPQTSHSCGGKIAAKVRDDGEKILWKCDGCGDNGEISHWRGSGWEDVPDEKTPKIVIVTKKPRAPKKPKQGILVLTKKELSALKKEIRDPAIMDLLTKARPLDAQEFAISLTIDQLDDLYCFVGDLLDFGPSRQRKMWDETLNAIAWAMDEIAFAEAEEEDRKS